MGYIVVNRARCMPGRYLHCVVAFWAPPTACVCEYPHAKKSGGFSPGEYGGHSFFGQNLGDFAANYSLVAFDARDDDPPCRERQVGGAPNSRLQSGNYAPPRNLYVISRVGARATWGRIEASHPPRKLRPVDTAAIRPPRQTPMSRRIKSLGSSGPPKKFPTQIARS